MYMKVIVDMRLERSLWMGTLPTSSLFALHEKYLVRWFNQIISKFILRFLFVAVIVPQTLNAFTWRTSTTCGPTSFTAATRISPIHLHSIDFRTRPKFVCICELIYICTAREVNKSAPSKYNSKM